MQLRDWFFGLFGRRARTEEVKGDTAQGITHVIILDGTASSLAEGEETNAGLLFKLLREQGRRENLMVHYEAGVQWRDWRSTWEVVTGRGINRLIRRAYGVLAGRWKPGDRIVLVGYSRGAFAVRSLAGMIGRVGLLKSHHATVSHIRTAYRHYEAGGGSEAARAFRAAYCHETCRIEAVAVWDTVKALGVRLPLIWRLSEGKTEFHDARLGDHVGHGFHALALDERRIAYRPVLWRSPQGWNGHLEQVWFRGTHGDVGGHLNGFSAARPLANIPLVWMLERLEDCGVSLPDGWTVRFPQNSDAPSVGQWQGWAKIFWIRRRRDVGRDPSERVHDGSVTPAS
ncbi:MAG: DUF2235 domain-containing protein [Paracoccaceae bacterium]